MCEIYLHRVGRLHGEFAGGRATCGLAGNKKAHQRTAGFLGMVAEDGIEPPTRGFSIPCSTN